MAGSGLTTTVSTKGRVVLPKAIRDQLQWGAGTRLTVEPTAGGVKLTPVRAVFVPTKPEDVFECLAYVEEIKSVEEMEAGIAAEVGRRNARGRC